MKKSFFPCALYMLALIGLAVSCADKVASPEVRYVQVVDSARIIQLEHELQIVRDSITALKADTTMSADEFVIRYKLERIKYYNKIAAKGNNIKYLRGWINRVLEE